MPNLVWRMTNSVIRVFPWSLENSSRRRWFFGFLVETSGWMRVNEEDKNRMGRMGRMVFVGVLD
jgi:hypothetical protein